MLSAIFYRRPISVIYRVMRFNVFVTFVA